MRSKVNWASGIAVAATFAAALIGGENSSAFADEMIPAIVDPVPAPAAATTFVSEPVVQALPGSARTEAQPSGKDESDADSLAELVARQDTTEQLSSEIHCLAGAIYFESRGESLDGQLAVGRVVVRRANSGRFPDSYCGVVFQRAQFSFVRGNAMPGIRKETRAWREAVALAQIADKGTWDSKAEGALFFHAKRVSPGWGRKRMAQVDNHIFYR